MCAAFKVKLCFSKPCLNAVVLLARIFSTYMYESVKKIIGKVYEKRDLACIIKKYNKNALRLICYNFRTVNAITFLFSTLHTAPFLYGRIHFEVLHLLRVSIATFDTPQGSNPP